MIIAIEHRRHPAYGPITELHCPNRHCVAVGEAIRRLTGEHPVPVPLCGCTVAYFARGLDVEEACALLRLVLLDEYPSPEIDRELIGCEVALERQDRDRFGPERFRTAALLEDACADCQLLRLMQGDRTR